MNLAILQANLGNFDTPKDPVEQSLPKGIDLIEFHRWTDSDFPPITGLTPRLQYRIPKMFGWQMLPDYDFYIWLDGSCSFLRDDCATYYLEQLAEHDIAFFKHPNRSSIKEEVEHLETYLNRLDGTKRGQDYVIKRYANGLHKEQLKVIEVDKNYKDDKLYASTTFIYRNTPRVQSMMRDWWFYQSRYWTCDQVPLPWVCDNWGLKVALFDQPLWKTGYMSLVSQHD